jgi:hypothetical protein
MDKEWRYSMEFDRLGKEEISVTRVRTDAPRYAAERDLRYNVRLSMRVLVLLSLRTNTYPLTAHGRRLRLCDELAPSCSTSGLGGNMTLEEWLTARRHWEEERRRSLIQHIIRYGTLTSFSQKRETDVQSRGTHQLAVPIEAV